MKSPEAWKVMWEGMMFILSLVVIVGILIIISPEQL